MTVGPLAGLRSNRVQNGRCLAHGCARNHFIVVDSYGVAHYTNL